MNDERNGLPAACQAARDGLVESLREPVVAGAPALDPSVDRHLAECADCRAEAQALRAGWEALTALPEIEPSAALSSRFHAWLEDAVAAESSDTRATAESVRPTRSTRSARPAPWRLWPAAPPGAQRRRESENVPRWGWAAVAATLVVGVLAGTAWRRPAQNAELAALRDEVRTLNRLVTLSLLSQPDASDRLQGVSYGRVGAGGQTSDARVVDALIETLRTDENVNVRLAAVDALAAAARDAGTRRRLESAFAEQQAPMVQIALADVLLASDQEAGRDSLLQILASPSAARLDATVREHMRKQLSPASTKS